MSVKYPKQMNIIPPTLLVVEDDPDSQELLKMLLEGEGYCIIQAQTGEEAVDMVRTHDHIHLVILDLMLPDIPGTEVCKKMKTMEGNRFVPVLMLTAKSETADQITGLDVGADDYVTKPFINDVLIAKIQALLRIKELMDFQIRVLDSIDSALFCLNRDCRILSLNKKARDFFSVTSKDIGDSVSEFMSGFRSNFVNEIVDYVCEKNIVYTLNNVSYKTSAPQAQRRFFNVRCFPLVATEGSDSVVLLFDEVTKRVRLQNRLLSSSKNTLLGDITMTLAHNLNNPLTSVYGRVEYLLSKIEPEKVPEYVVKNLRIVQEYLNKVLEIIRDVSMFAGGKEYVSRRCNIHDVINKALALTDHELACHGIEIQTEFDQSIPQILLDENSVEQALINIIMNAKEAMSQGGVFKIETKKLDEEKFLLKFCDTGCGIPENERAYVFDLFYSKKETNIGLGLTTVARVVQEHGGTVKLESEVNKGTCVTIELPVFSDKEETSVINP